jgi:hypothetical protein
MRRLLSSESASASNATNPLTVDGKNGVNTSSEKSMVWYGYSQQDTLAMRLCDLHLHTP